MFSCVAAPPTSAVAPAVPALAVVASILAPAALAVSAAIVAVLVVAAVAAVTLYLPLRCFRLLLMILKLLLPLAFPSYNSDLYCSFKDTEVGDAASLDWPGWAWDFASKTVCLSVALSAKIFMSFNKVQVEKYGKKQLEIYVF